jgi:hypothetical protein
MSVLIGNDISYREYTRFDERERQEVRERKNKQRNIMKRRD